MKKLICVFLLATSSLAASAQSSALFDKIYNSGILCNLEDFMVEHSLNELKRDPQNEQLKEQLQSAQQSSSQCLSAAIPLIRSSCQSSIDRLLDKGLLCTSEEATVEAAYTIYQSRPTPANRAELQAAQAESARCGAKAYAICKK